jgi:hypothetical protein
MLLSFSVDAKHGAALRYRAESEDSDSNGKARESRARRDTRWIV